MQAAIRSLTFACLALLAWSGVAAASGKLEAEVAAIQQWRAQRLASLTSDTGWLTLAGLFWLKPGENTFGRAPSNTLVLDNPALASQAGSFFLSGHDVRFVARPGAHITHGGMPVSTISLVSDANNDPTVLESGPLRFFVIERAGNLGVRVRDLDNPRRKNFHGLEYFPVSLGWVLPARFVPYKTHHQISIVNILGMEQQMDCPGALVFRRHGRTWRLDAVLESPQDQQLMIIFSDGTSGHETYGGGRFLYAPLPDGGRTVLDFNKAYSPPCAFSDFATCPLPPYQNRLKLRIDAGEKTYAGGEHHGVAAP